MTTLSFLRSNERPERIYNPHQTKTRFFYVFKHRAHPPEQARFQDASPLTSLRIWSILLVLLTSPAVCESQSVNIIDRPVFKPTPTSINFRSLDDERSHSHPWQLEIIGSLFREAWDLNHGREQPIGGAIRFTRNLRPYWSIGFEAALLHVSRNLSPHIFLPAWSFMLQRNLFRVGATTVIAEGSGGLSYASDRVPARGTRFNLISQLGIGLLGNVNPKGRLVTGVRWLHLSNNGLGGNGNPDIQAIGVYFGWRLP